MLSFSCVVRLTFSAASKAGVKDAILRRDYSNPGSIEGRCPHASSNWFGQCAGTRNSEAETLIQYVCFGWVLVYNIMSFMEKIPNVGNNIVNLLISISSAHLFQSSPIPSIVIRTILHSCFLLGAFVGKVSGEGECYISLSQLMSIISSSARERLSLLEAQCPLLPISLVLCDLSFSCWIWYKLIVLWFLVVSWWLNGSDVWHGNKFICNLIAGIKFDNLCAFSKTFWYIPHMR